MYIYRDHVDDDVDDNMALYAGSSRILFVSGDIDQVYVGHISDIYRVHLVTDPCIVCSLVICGSFLCGLGWGRYEGAVVGTASAKFSFKILVSDSCV